MTQSSNDEPGSTNEGESTDSEPVAQAVSTSTQKVVGETGATDATGVLGRTTAGTSVTYGVRGETQSSSDGATGVHGHATADSGVTRGVHGEANNLDSYGVVGEATTDSYSLNDFAGYPMGVYGITDRNGDDAGVYVSTAVLGWNKGSTGDARGVWGLSASPDGYGVYGGNSAGGDALYADGDATVDGNHEVTGSQTIGSLGASVYLSSTQSIPTNSSTTVEFDSIVADDLRGWNIDGNHVFTCHVDGDYHVSTTVNWSSNFPGGTIHDLAIRVNSSTKAQTSQSTDSDSSSGILAEHVCKTLRGLTSGDTISVKVRHTSGGSEDLSTGEHETYLTIDKIG